MDETQTQLQPPAAPTAVGDNKLTGYRVTKGSRLGFWIVKIFNELLILLSLRGRRKFWGIVYDSVTKQPLDPVIVKLVYVGSDRVVETCVTDLGGGYGFLARPGSFKILPNKSNYSFPSQIASGMHDGVYRNIYHGEFFHLSGDAEVLAPNIPMDPVTKDWNQQAKRQILNTHPYWSRLIRGLESTVFWFGFVLVLVYAGFQFWQTLTMPALWIIVVLVVYLFLIFLKIGLPHVRLWGMVRDGATGQPLTGVKVTLTNPAIRGMTMGSATTNDFGKFLLRARPGKYELQFALKNINDGFEPLSSTVAIHVGNEGVVNYNIYVTKTA